MIRNIQLLGQLYYRPVAAMSAILDEGSLLFALAAAAVGYGLCISLPIPLWAIFSLVSMGSFLLAFLPACILFVSVFDHRSRVGQMLQQDYVPLLTCALMGEAAVTFLIVAIDLLLALTGAVPWMIFGCFVALSCLVQLCAVRVVFGLTYWKAGAVFVCAGAVFIGGLFVMGMVGGMSRFLLSPFLLYWLYRYYSNDFRALGSAFQAKQNFRRHLEALTINPHDGEAQYQLGLIYLNRRQYEEAISRFKKAIEIDWSETDAHFQLGRIARIQGRFKDALGHFQTVLDQNEKHHFSDTWREIGAIHFSAGQYEHALPELERFVERRPYDPEGLYYLGETLLALGRKEEGKAMMRRAIEAAKTAPGYRRGELRKWSGLAQKRV